MKIYTLTITETLKREVDVEAETLNEAINKAWHMYDDERIVLDSRHHVETEIKAEEDYD